MRSGKDCIYYETSNGQTGCKAELLKIGGSATVSKHRSKRK